MVADADHRGTVVVALTGAVAAAVVVPARAARLRLMRRCRRLAARRALGDSAAAVRGSARAGRAAGGPACVPDGRGAAPGA